MQFAYEIHPLCQDGDQQRKHPQLDSPWYCCCCSEPLFLRDARCPLYVGCDEGSCCFPASPRPSMSILLGCGAPAGLSRGSWSLLKPRMTSILWTRPPAAMPPPLPISWKWLGERQLSSTMLMVSSDKCIRASGCWEKNRAERSQSEGQECSGVSGTTWLPQLSVLTAPQPAYLETRRREVRGRSGRVKSLLGNTRECQWKVRVHKWFTWRSSINLIDLMP